MAVLAQQRSIAAVALLCCATALAPYELDLPTSVRIPYLPWEPRADWANVKGYGAVGDGVADDTSAVRAAIHAVLLTKSAAMPPKTLFFPAGVYLISSTLHINYTYGIKVLGCGRATTLRWTGPANANDDSRLFWSDGNTRATWEGFVLDGQGISGTVGLDHDSHFTVYETRIVHRHILFMNWTIAGFRVGPNPLVPGGIPSAEMSFENCAFWANSGAGAAFMQWNDYDNYFTGCAFINNTAGIQSPSGNYYVTATRFEGSSAFDAAVPDHANSFRRVVSVGSNAFLSGAGRTTKVHGCYIENWGTRAAATPAISVRGHGTFQLVDTVFSSPAHNRSSAFGFADGGGKIQLLLSNASMLNATAPLLDLARASAFNVSGGGRLYVVPPGDPALAAHLPPLSGRTHFLRSDVRMPARVFDAVRDFGADYTGRTASTGQLQACISAAAAAANGSVCYLWAGQYKMNRTLVACGSSFSIEGGGQGFMTQVRWAAEVPGPGIVFATGPGAGCVTTNFTIRNINFNCAGNVSSVAGGCLDFVVSRAPVVPRALALRYPRMPLPAASMQPAGATALAAAACAPVRLELDTVSFTSSAGGVILGLNAGDAVWGNLWDGHLTVVDSEHAVVLTGFMNGGTQAGVVGSRSELAEQYWQRPCVAGREGMVSASSLVPGLPGITGAVTMAVASPEYDVYAFNSSSFAVGDIYSETSAAILYAEGDGHSPPGSVVLSHSKLNIGAPGITSVVINDYEGLVMISGAMELYSNFTVVANGTRPVEFALVTGATWAAPVDLSEVANPNASVTMIGNSILTGPQVFDQDILPSRANDVIMRGFDRLRLIAIWDMYLNFRWLMSAPPSTSPSPTTSSTATATSSVAASSTSTATGSVSTSATASVPASVSAAVAAAQSGTPAASGIPRPSSRMTVPGSAAGTSGSMDGNSTGSAAVNQTAASGVSAGVLASTPRDDTSSVVAGAVLATLSVLAMAGAVALYAASRRARRKGMSSAVLQSQSAEVRWGPADSTSASRIHAFTVDGEPRPLSVALSATSNPLHASGGVSGSTTEPPQRRVVLQLPALDPSTAERGGLTCTSDGDLEALSGGGGGSAFLGNRERLAFDARPLNAPGVCTQ